MTNILTRFGFQLLLQKQYIHPPHSSQTAQVLIPVSTIYTSFIPHLYFQHYKSITVKCTLQRFHNYSSSVMLSNTSSFPQFIRKGAYVGYLVCHSMFQSSRVFTSSLYESFGAISKTDVIPAHGNSAGENKLTTKSHHSCNIFFQNSSHLRNCNKTPLCNTILSANPTVEDNIKKLVNKIENKQQRHDFHSLLVRFQHIFDLTKYNIANTPIHHVINTISHSPPASQPCPQPDKEEAMYKLIQ